jgi:WD40 repeat protein
MDNYKLQEFVAHSTQVNCLSIGPKSNQVFATGGEDTKINVWRVGNTNNIWTLAHNKAPIESLCFDPEENCLVSGAMNGSLKVFDLAEGKLARHLGGHPTSITSLQYHPYGELVVSGSTDCNMKVWDIRNKLCIQTYTGHSKEITCVRFSPDGKWVASSSRDGQIFFFDLLAGKLVNSIKIAPTYITNFEFNPAEFSMAAITSARNCKVWDLDTMECTHSTPSESTYVRSIAFSSVGSSLFTAARDLKIWSLDGSLRLAATVDAGWDKLADMKIYNNSQLIAGSFNSNFVSIWGMDLEDVLAEPAKDEMPAVPVEPTPLSRAEAKHTPTNPVIAASSGSEKSTPSKSRGPQQQQQLNKVRQQLSQLSVDMGFEDVTHAGASPAPKIPLSSADSKSSNDMQSKPLPFQSAGDDHRQSDDKNAGFSSGDDVKDSNSGKPPTVGVTWDAGSDAADMATSMGESFWKRFKESQQQRERNISPLSGERGSDSAADRGLSDEELNKLLPGSNFDQKSVNGGAVGRSEGIAAQRSSRTAASRGTSADDDVGNAVRDVRRVAPPVPASSYSSSTAAAVGSVGGGVITGGPVGRKNADGSSTGAYGGGSSSGSGSASSSGINSSDSNMEIVGMSHHHRKSNSGSGGGAADIGGPYGSTASQSVSQVSNGPSEYQKVDEYLTKIVAASSSLSSLFSHRLASLRTLRQLWAKGDVLDAIDHLTILSDSLQHSPQNLQPLADFFDAVELKASGLSLDACVKLLPVLDEMTSLSDSWASEHVIYAGFKSFDSLCEGFGELIRQTRAVIVTGGVDLSREARLVKCNACHSIFVKALQRVTQLKHHFRKNSKVIEVLDSFYRHASIYCGGP